MIIPSRRSVLLGLSALPLAACTKAPNTEFDASAYEKDNARWGFYALNLSTGESFGQRTDERFAMCSTFKWILAAFVLKEFFDGRQYIRMPTISFSEADIIPYAPVTKPALVDGKAEMGVDALCAAAVSLSDNVAANLLLNEIGGPEGFTQKLRALGDETTRLDRWEPMLNENLMGDPRDTTTPAAMVALLQTILFTDQLLNPQDQAVLKGWMINTKTGLKRLRAGFPQDWTVGDKTGTSGNGAYNDVGFALAPRVNAPILMASFLNSPNKDGNTTHAALGQYVADNWSAP